MNVIHLIKLDLYAMKPLAKSMLCFLFIPIILGLVTNLGTSIMVTLTFVVFILNMIFAITEKSHFDKLYGILPIKRSMNIISRYLFSLLVLSLAAIVSFLIFILLSLFQNGVVDWISGFAFLTVSIVISLFFVSIQYPFYFHFEYSKATIMSILPYVLCFAIGAPLIQYLMKDIAFYLFVMDIIVYFQSNIIILIILGFTLSVVMILSSCLLSLKIQKREF